MITTITKKQHIDNKNSEFVHDSQIDVPANMEASLQAIKEVCETMFGIRLETAGQPRLFSSDGMEYGVGINLLYDEGSWELGLFGNKESSHSLVKAFLGLTEDCDPQSTEVVDLLGEIVNMASGLVKRTIPCGEDITLGVPLHLVAEDCKTYMPHTIPVIAQPLSGPDFDGEILLVWSDRNSVSLVGEIAGVLNGSTPKDTKLMGRAIALFEEFKEYLDETDDNAICLTIENCLSVVMGLINEDISDSKSALHWVCRVVNEFAASLREKYDDQYIAPPMPDFRTFQEVDKFEQQVLVERDDETLEIIADFIQESEEGLNDADQVLMRLESGDDDPEGINALFRVFHSIKGLSSFLDIKDVTSLAHTTETLLAMSREGKLKLYGTPLDVVFEATEMMRQQLEAVSHAVETKLSFPETKNLSKLIALLEAVIRGENVQTRQIPTSQKAASSVPATSQTAQVSKKKETVKISVELIERLTEVTTSFNQLDPKIKNLESSVLAGEDLKRLITACSVVCEVAKLMQMVPVSMLFQKMTRMVRDLSKKTGKLAQLTLSGVDTLIARNIIEKLNDPLVHMIRNAVDHGIEDTDERKSSGKPPLGAIGLTAWCDENSGKKQAFIELKDDGKGLDPKMLKEKAISKGIIESNTEMSDEDAFHLIFAAGFSTAGKVTAISGRGVGMDVVRKNIESIGGNISITSEVGVGSVFTITLPWST